VTANNLLKGPQTFALVVTGDGLTNFATVLIAGGFFGICRES